MEPEFHASLAAHKLLSVYIRPKTWLHSVSDNSQVKQCPCLHKPFIIMKHPIML